jgi:hypothetical protein
MIYLTDMFHQEWIPEESISITTLGFLDPINNLDELALIIKHLNHAHVILHGRDSYVSWIYESFGLLPNRLPTSPPFGFKIESGDTLLIALWRGRKVD